MTPTPRLIRLPETESTNTFAINMIAAERPQEATVIIADHQTKGKGTDQNSWESECGKNLTFSIILYPKITADRQFDLNKAIAVGIFAAVKKELPGQKVSIKWPNDIYVGDKKLAGILIQNSVIGMKFDYVVIGIGLNVNQEHFLSNAPNPVSMKLLTGKEHDLEPLLDRILASVLSHYEMVNKGKAKEVLAAYHSALFRLAEWHDYLIRGKKVHASLTGVNEFGQLVLEDMEEEVFVCDMKEVRFLFWEE